MGENDTTNHDKSMVHEASTNRGMETPGHGGKNTTFNKQIVPK